MLHSHPIVSVLHSHPFDPITVIMIAAVIIAVAWILR